MSHDAKEVLGVVAFIAFLIGFVSIPVSCGIYNERKSSELRTTRYIACLQAAVANPEKCEAVLK